jgi:dGTPase
VAERLDLARLDRPAIWTAVRAGDLPDADDDTLDAALSALTAVDSWPEAAYDGSRRSLAALKNLTSDLIGRFCGAVQEATFATASGPFVRYRANLVVPEQTLVEMAVLKGIAAHYVMQADDRLALMSRERELISELVAALLAHAPHSLDRAFADDWQAASDDAARLRVVIDQVASLTDASAVAWHDRLVRKGTGAR